MWWQTLPSLSIMFICASLIPISTYVTNYLFLGNPYKRQMHSINDAYYYLRDMRLSGKEDAYKLLGLDDLPSGPDDK